jgi:hypothetical protein
MLRAVTSASSRAVWCAASPRAPARARAPLKVRAYTHVLGRRGQVGIKGHGHVSVGSSRKEPPPPPPPVAAPAPAAPAVRTPCRLSTQVLAFRTETGARLLKQAERYASLTLGARDMSEEQLAGELSQLMGPTGIHFLADGVIHRADRVRGAPRVTSWAAAAGEEAPCGPLAWGARLCARGRERVARGVGHAAQTRASWQACSSSRRPCTTSSTTRPWRRP